MGATYFLLRGLRKVTGEVAFFGVGHNIERIPPSPPKIRLSENSFLKFSDHITSLLFSKRQIRTCSEIFGVLL